MTPSSRIRITVEGADHSGKSSAIALIARLLEETGAKVVVQKADPQIAEKLAADDATLRGRLRDVDILILETRTAR